MTIRIPRPGVLLVAVVVLAAFVPLVLHTITFLAHGAEDVATPRALTFAIPDEVPPGTEIVVADQVTQYVFEQAGWAKDLPFRIKWTAIVGGPAISEAMNAHALDAAVASDIPPIQSYWSGVPVRILAVHGRKYPERYPTYKFAIAPNAKVNSFADFRGKRIVTSKGQIAGMLVMRTLAKAGIPQDDVKLVDIAMGDDYYMVALGSGAADIAPLASGIQTDRFMKMHGPAGGKLLDQDVFRDDMRILYAREKLLEDPAKAAALKHYARYVGRAVEWINQHPDRWIKAYYIRKYGLKRAEAEAILKSAGPLDVHADWNAFRKAEQESIDFLATETGQPRFDVSLLLDPRFEQVAAQGFREQAAGAR